MKNFNKLMLGVILLTLAACGGGGGGGGSSGPVSSTLSFPLQSGIKSYTANTDSKTFNVNGTENVSGTSATITGSGTQSKGAPLTNVTFLGKPALSYIETVTWQSKVCASSCISVSIAGSVTAFVDSNYNPLGDFDGTTISVWKAIPSVPSSVTIGTTGYVGRKIEYSNSTGYSTGYDDVTFAIEPDTANTAIVNEIIKKYDLYGNLLITSQVRFRILSTGSLTRISEDDQFTDNNLHLMFTYN
jgi:hypothetical protein